MEKQKLSDLIACYQQKIEKSNDFFGLYFEETDIESKLGKLKLMYKALGDITIPLEHFKVFLYAGHWYGNKSYFHLTESMITDVYDIIKKYDDMPLEIIDRLLYHYHKKCFEEYHVKEYFDLLVSKYQFSEETLSKIDQYIEDSYKKLKDSYSKESDKLELISDQYPSDFIRGLKDIITSSHIKYDDLIEQLPSNTLFKPTIEHENEFWAKYNDYVFMLRLLKEEITLDDYEDGDYMEAFTQIGQGEHGIECRKMYTSFTKKEYLAAIKAGKVKNKLKGSV